jgi:hypothetical protein
MRLPRVRFTIRGLLIAVVVIAGLLALPGRWGVLAILLFLMCLSVITARWLFLQGNRRLAAFGFWIPAILVNLLFAASCVSPEIYFLGSLTLAWLLIVMPSIAGFGITWALLAIRRGEARRRSRSVAWLSVIATSLMPVVMVWSHWPLHLAFLASRPALEHLADQVASGQAVVFPRWVGPFRIAGSAIDPVTGNVGLMTYPNPSGPTGFVRVGPGTTPYDRFRPIRVCLAIGV